MLEPLENMQFQRIWEKFQSTWARTFSVPEIVIVDQGRGFSKEKASEAGALLRDIGARAPWQQGNTQHGDLAKEVFMRVREESSQSMRVSGRCVFTPLSRQPTRVALVLRSTSLAITRGFLAVWAQMMSMTPHSGDSGIKFEHAEVFGDPTLCSAQQCNC